MLKLIPPPLFSDEFLVAKKLIPHDLGSRGFRQVCFNSGIGTLSLSITKPWLLTVAAVLKLGGGGVNGQWHSGGGGWLD